MEAKLTITLNKNVIERAKTYAKNHKISLSKMIETYLDLITRQKPVKNEISTLVWSLSGVSELPQD